MVRAPMIDENGMKKGAWSLEEDNKLRAYIQKYGPRRWRLIPTLAGLTRCGKSCRLRWLNYLHPDVKRGNYTEEENELICELHEKYGNKWSAIAAKLPGRTDNEIKNHWHTNLKKKGKKQNLSFQEKPNEIFQDQNQNEKQEEITEAFCDYSSSDFGILESSSLFQETSSDNDNNLAFSSINSVVENHYGYGDFWTEPFISDSAMDSLSPLTAEYGITSPLHMITYDDYVDFLY